MLDRSSFKKIRYYLVYQLVFVILSVLLTSMGAFFHFLLDHEISIVESWLHNSHWEILIVSKALSLFILNRWFNIRLYQLKTIRQLVKELIRRPEQKAIVLSFFILASYLSLSKMSYAGQNLGYWYYHFISYLGISLFFGLEFIVIAYLNDILDSKESNPQLPLAIAFTIIFSIAYRICVPDYYGLWAHIVFCYSTLLYLSGKSFKNWSNVLCFLFFFVAPVGAFCGFDPIWGDDFSIFKLDNKLKVPFLLVIWMISFSYYKYRELFLNSARKLIR